MTPVVEPLAEAEILTFLVSGFSGMVNGEDSVF